MKGLISAEGEIKLPLRKLDQDFINSSYDFFYIFCQENWNLSSYKINKPNSDFITENIFNFIDTDNDNMKLRIEYNNTSYKDKSLFVDDLFIILKEKVCNFDLQEYLLFLQYICTALKIKISYFNNFLSIRNWNAVMLDNYSIIEEIGPAETNMLNQVLENNSKNIHVFKSIECFQKGDYPNSLKEITSAIEELFNVKLGQNSFPNGIKSLKFHENLEASILNFYYYACDANGARHGGTITGDYKKLDKDQSLFMLV